MNFINQFFGVNKVNFFKIALTLITILVFGIIYTFFDESEFIYRDDTHNQFAKIKNIFFERLYFSIITQTTIGYGDIVPNSDATRFVVAIQALSTILIILM